MLRATSILLASTALICAACGQPDRAVVEAQRPAAAVPERTPPPTASSSPRIVFLGDSLTAGYGLAKEESVPSLIASHLRAEGYAYRRTTGVPGEKATVWKIGSPAESYRSTAAR